MFRPGWYPEEPFTALFVGKLIPLHGLETILEAARLAPELRLRVVGSGQLDALLDRPARQTSTGSPGSSTSSCRRAARAACALGIFGTRAKAQRVIPNKAFQALACGVPLVTADTPAARELLVDGESALLVPPGDPEALADALRRLATSRSSRATRRRRPRRLPRAGERRGARAALARDPRARSHDRATSGAARRSSSARGTSCASGCCSTSSSQRVPGRTSSTPARGRERSRPPRAARLRGHEHRRLPPAVDVLRARLRGRGARGRASPTSRSPTRASTGRARRGARARRGRRGRSREVARVFRPGGVVATPSREPGAVRPERRVGRARPPLHAAGADRGLREAGPTSIAASAGAFRSRASTIGTSMSATSTGTDPPGPAAGTGPSSPPSARSSRSTGSSSASSAARWATSLSRASEPSRPLGGDRRLRGRLRCACGARHRAFKTGRFDLGNMTQAVWSTANGDPLDVTEPGGDQFSGSEPTSTRSSPLFAPLWLVWPSPSMLLVVQAVRGRARGPAGLLARPQAPRLGVGRRALARLSVCPPCSGCDGRVPPGRAGRPFLAFAFWYLDEDRLCRSCPSRCSRR